MIRVDSCISKLNRCILNYSVSILLHVIFVNCSSNYEISLENALELAGDNRSELELVLSYYQHDSLKLEAARFLIKNMPYHFYLVEYYLSPDGEKYRPDINSFNNSSEMQNYCNSLLSNGYRYIKERHSDIITIKSGYLIKNIDMAFAAWEKPWAKDISFSDFCMYILPYRAQTEMPSDLREEMYNRFVPLLDSAMANSSLEACIVVNEYLKDIMRYKDPGLSFYPTIEETYQSGISRCEGLCDLGTFIMRAIGVPVAVDQTIWTKMDLGHSWCVVLSDNKFYSFGPGEDQPGEHAKQYSEVWYRKPAKVYRAGFAPTNFNLNRNDDGFITFLKNPLFYDVTNEYLDEVSLEFVTSPFYVDINGDINKLVPDSNNLISYTLKKRENRIDQAHTLRYWNVKMNDFVSINPTQINDSTQEYDQIPSNALLWFTVTDRILNQRIFFIDNDSIRVF